jgi:hypothetical protein
LPTNITDLYQSPTNTTAPPGYVHNKYKTVPCKNFQLGYCKYGDRCTFAHGDVDLRAKFVPASSLYPSTSGEMGQEQIMQTPLPPPMSAPGQNYSGIDYSSFSQPSDSFQVFGSSDTGYQQQSPFGSYEQHDDMQAVTNNMQAMNLGPTPTPQHAGHYTYNNGQFMSPQVPPSQTNGMKTKETSKYGFGYESLAESIDELELRDPTNKQDQVKFSEAKAKISEGNVDEADVILTELKESKKISYKQMTYFDNNIFMDSFAPISDSN